MLRRNGPSPVLNPKNVWVPTQGVLLESNLTVRRALELDRRHRYDILFCTQN